LTLLFTFPQHQKLENAAIANALQLEAARATPALSLYNYDEVWSRWTYPLPYYSVFCCWYITFQKKLSVWSLTLQTEIKL